MWHRLALTSLLCLSIGTSVAQDEAYSVEIDPADFVETMSHPYFSFAPDTLYVYEGETEDGLEHIEVSLMPETREVMGVTTSVVRDSVWLDGDLIEDTFDWYAQDTDGNVWYFGEDTHEYEDGVAINSEGAWEAGIDGALPGIVMLVNPHVGDSYRLEYYEGEAEDEAEVLSLTETVEIGMGTYENVLMTRDWTDLEPDVEEHKYYAEELGLILEVGLESEESIELIAVITLDGTETSPETTPIISEEDALAIGEELLGEAELETTLAFTEGRWIYTVSGSSENIQLDAITGEALED